MKLSPFAIILKTHILYVFDAFKRINKFSWMLSLNLKAQTKKHQGIEQVLLNHLTQQFLQILKDFFFHAYIGKIMNNNQISSSQ